METSLSEFLGDQSEWKVRLNQLALKGVNEDDLAHWLWILEAEATDLKVERFLSSDRHKPIFVLMAILRADEYMLKGSSLVNLYDYIARTYFRRSAGFREYPPKSVILRTLNNQLNMSPTHFMLLIRRLVHHCLKTFPSSIVTISRLVVDYLRTIPDATPNKSNRRTGYADRCMIFNFALHNFRRTSRTKPLVNMPHNWKAQKILLGFSAGSKRPLIINRQSYRAIRIVLMGLKKTQDEKRTAMRHAKTWPPYIRQLDGIDEARDTQEYLSRNVKAGILKRQEGYADDLVDRALGTLGGAALGESVTIQTRSLAPTIWFKKYRGLQVFTDWAAKVKATRNSHEAWQLFHEPPLPNLKPNFQVYAEMFSKLFAMEIDYTSSVLPGDAKEVYPPHLVNLTEFERERLRPCSAEELYQRMLQDGNRPVRHCLALLIRNAPSLEKAAVFLNDSPLDKRAIEEMTTSKSPRYEMLSLIPITIFDAYVGLLCYRQGRQRWVPNPKHKPRYENLKRYDNLNHAVKLVCTRLGPQRLPARTPWHTVMRALAAKKLVLRPYVTQAEDDVEALKKAISLFNAYKLSQGLHTLAFDCLARCTLKVLSHEWAPVNEHMMEQPLSTAVDLLKSTFWELATPVQSLSNRFGEDLPILYHELSSAHIWVYVEVLAKLREVDEGVRVMEWVLSMWDKNGVLEQARTPAHKQWPLLKQAFIVFRAFTEGNVPEEVMERIEKRFEELQAEGSTWTWPHNEEVVQYLEAQAGESEAGG